MYFEDEKRLRRLISYRQLGELKVLSVTLVKRRESSKYQAKFTVHHALWYSVQNMNRYDEHTLNSDMFDIVHVRMLLTLCRSLSHKLVP